RFIKNNNIPVVWTMHDCWAFTGQCTHFIVAKCDKWKNGCYSCPQYKEYPEAYVDQTKLMWNKKKKWFCKIENMTIVTPSKWLSGLVNQSFLKEYPVKVIHNGIDTSIFKPSKSNIIEKYNIPTNKIIILSVAYSWGYKKGLDILIDLIQRLNSTKYHFIIVGTDKKIDEQLKYNNILSIHRTQNQKELVEIYSAADLFINPTLEDNYPTVNLESIACGTPVITFRTGGSPETIIDNMGCVVNYKDIDAMEKAITNYNIDVNRKQYIDFNKIDNSVRVLEYIDLYNNIVKSRGLNYG
ncbi:MAG: glycosyltransferase, partial [Candidatus Cloacimonetes bacterium]|nr:glycosyltransferase [Candidatus Cloacimonadota bacterium]